MNASGVVRRRSLSSLQSRITLLLIGLLAVVLAGVLLATWVSTDRNVRAQVGSELEVGARVFDELMATRARQLVESVAVLANDFAFREAVATDDAATIASALDNHGGRISADRAFLLDLDGKVVTGLDAQGQDRVFPLQGLLVQARQDEGAAAIVMLDERAFQVVLVPVRTPLPSAWAGMAFELDAELARSFSQLMRLELVILDDSGRALAASHPGLETFRLGAGTGGPHQFREGDDRYLGLTHRPASPDAAPRVLLAASLDQVFAPYRSLGMQLLGIVLVALLLAVLAAWWMASSVSRPVRQLAAAAGRIAGGHYEETISSERSDEIGHLARAFTQMQSGIQQREQRIRFQAQHDRLTGLPNRSHARHLLSELIEADGHDRFGVLMLDIRGFRQINDSLGHDTGDEVLQVVATQLSELAGSGATVSRLGADEFMVVTEGLDAEAARALAGRMTERLIDTPLPDRKVSLRIECSVGVALSPEHGDDAETLMRRADIALAEARRELQTIAVYRHGRDEQHLHQLQLARDLPEAIREGELRMLLQPKIALKTGAVIGAEALVRWQHPEFGLLTPDRFVELAERSGRVRDITRWVLDNAIERLSSWQRDGHALTIAVNLSALDLSDEGLAEWLEERVEASEVPARNLMLEITETAVMQDVEQARRMLGGLRALGMSVAIDDFGTGHSSLAQLQSLPVDQLKIDKSFVLGLKEDQAANATIVTSIIELGHRMGLGVIAEGIEDPSDWRWLAESGCDLGQGFGIARPMPEADFLDWLDRYDGGCSRDQEAR